MFDSVKGRQISGSRKYQHHIILKYSSFLCGFAKAYQGCGCASCRGYSLWLCGCMDTQHDWMWNCAFICHLSFVASLTSLVCLHFFLFFIEQSFEQIIGKIHQNFKTYWRSMSWELYLLYFIYVLALGFHKASIFGVYSVNCTHSSTSIYLIYSYQNIYKKKTSHNRVELSMTRLKIITGLKAR